MAANSGCGGETDNTKASGSSGNTGSGGSTSCTGGSTSCTGGSTSGNAGSAGDAGYCAPPSDPGRAALCLTWAPEAIQLESDPELDGKGVLAVRFSTRRL